MKCLYCKSKLTHSETASYEEHALEGPGVVSLLNCPNCFTDVLVYHTLEEAQYEHEIN